MKQKRFFQDFIEPSQLDLSEQDLLRQLEAWGLTVSVLPNGACIVQQGLFGAPHKFPNLPAAVRAYSQF